MTNNDSLLAAQATRRFIATYANSLNAALPGPWVQSLAMTQRTDQGSETFRMMSSTPVVDEFKGTRREVSLYGKSLTVDVHVDDVTLGFSVDDIRRQKFSMIDQRIRGVPRRFQQRKARLLTNLLEANGNAYTGSAFFSAHTDGKGSFDNAQQFNVATPADPTVDEARKVIESILERFLSYKDDQGEPIHEDTDGMQIRLMLPFTYRNAFASALGLQVIQGTGGAIDNTLTATADGVAFSISVNGRLTAGNNFLYAFREDTEDRPFIYLTEREPTNPVVNNQWAEHRRMQFIVEGIYGFGYYLPQMAQRVELT